MLDAERIKRLYPFPAIRCWRIVRESEQELGDLRLDGATALELGSNNLGVLAGGCPGTLELINRFRQLAECELPGKIVVALSSSVEAYLYHTHLGPATNEPRGDWWHFGCLTFTTPERLKRLGPGELGGRPVLAVVLVDPTGILHLARGGTWDAYSNNDRPQHLARFRATHEQMCWRPPFFLFTGKLAKSLSTDHMLGAYSLDGWWYVDGRRLRMGKPPKTLPDSGAMAGDAQSSSTDSR